MKKKRRIAHITFSNAVHQGLRRLLTVVLPYLEELAIDINSSKESAATFVIGAQKLLRDSKVIEKEFPTADVALEKRESMLKCVGLVWY